MYILTPFVNYMIACAVIVIVAFIYVHQKPPNTTRNFLLATIAMLFIWSVFAGLEYSATSIDAKVFWAKMKTIGLATTPNLFLLTVLSLLRPYGRDIKYWVWIIILPPLLSIFMAFTNEWHWFYWKAYPAVIMAGTNMAVFTKGWWFWTFPLLFTYGIILMVVLALYTYKSRSFKSYRTHANLLTIAMLPPTIGYFIYMYSPVMVAGYDPAPPLYLASVFIVIFNIYQFDLLNATPIQHDQITDTLMESIFVFDTKGRLIYRNPSAFDFIENFGYENADMDEKLTLMEGSYSDGSQQTVTLESGDGKRDIRKKFRSLRDMNGNVNGHLLLLDDITEQRRSQLFEQTEKMEQEKDAIFESIERDLILSFSELDKGISRTRENLEKDNKSGAISNLGDVDRVMNQTIKNIKLSILGARSEFSGEGGFIFRLTNYLDGFKELSRLDVQYSLPDEDLNTMMDMDIYLALVEILQDNLYYAANEGHATKAQVILTQENKALGLIYIDDRAARKPAERERADGALLRVRPKIEYRSSKHGLQLLARFPVFTDPTVGYPELIGARILIAEPRLMLAQSLIHYLRANSLITIGNAPQLDQLMDIMPRVKPDLLLLASRFLPELEKIIALKDSSMKLVIIGAGGEDGAWLKYQNAIDAWVMDEQNTESLKKALGAAMDGSRYYCPEKLHQIMGTTGALPQSKDDAAIKLLRSKGLSEKQIVILRGVMSGKPYKTVGAELVMTTSAIKYHVGTMINTLGLRDREELTMYAIEIGLEKK